MAHGANLTLEEHWLRRTALGIAVAEKFGRVSALLVEVTGEDDMLKGIKWEAMLGKMVAHGYPLDRETVLEARRTMDAIAAERQGEE